MWYGILIAIHIIVCIFLIAIVLIQAGRGGGLAESFTSAESIFGSKTNALLTRATTVLAVLFFITCLSLAILAKQRSASIIKGAIPQKTQVPAPVETTPPQVTPPEGPKTQEPQPAAAPAKEKAAEAQSQLQESQKQHETKPSN